MSTSREVAVLAGVSVSTVGRALSGDPRITPDTARRVREAATRLGYVVNQAAKVTRGGRSTVVGVLVPDLTNGFYATVAHALSEVLRRNAYQLMLGETADDRGVELEHVRSFAASRVAGIVIVPTGRPQQETARLLRTVPHVQFLRSHPALGRQSFGIDDGRSIATAADHLLALGHRDIAFIGGDATLSTGAARRKGFAAAMSAAGLSGHTELLESGPAASVEYGRLAVNGLLDRAAPPTAIVTASVQATRGALEALLERRVAVPQAMSIVGFGDEPGWSWWGPGLTTISLPIAGLATSCASWLVSRLTGDRPGADEPYTSISPGALTVRGSTAPPSARTRPSRDQVR